MLRLVALLILLFFAVTTEARSVRVKGYFRKDGTYVRPHVRTSPNSTTADNWSTKGNVNPHTGEEGTKDPDYPSPYPTFPTYPVYLPTQDYSASTSAYSPKLAEAPLPSSYNIQDADTFLDVCGGNYRAGRDTIGLGACQGFVNGIVEFDRATGQRAICMPDGTGYTEVVSSIAAALREHPEESSGPTIYMAWGTMAKNHPCPSEQAHEPKSSSQGNRQP
jgi:hypothetical protein